MCAHEGPGPLESEPKEALLPNATYLAEAKDQLRIGVPVAFSAVIRRSMVVVTVAVVGRLGPDAMAAAALAVSATNTFALSVMVGLSSASTTLVSQAVGAKDSRQAGLWLHRALLVHAMAAVPLTLMLLCFGPLLLAMGQDVALSKSAGTYACLLVPGMWGWSCMWALQPFDGENEWNAVLDEAARLQLRFRRWHTWRGYVARLVSAPLRAPLRLRGQPLREGSREV